MRHPNPLSRFWVCDPRLYQIAVLGALLVYGISWLDFDISGAQASVILAMALATQWVCSRVWKLNSFDPRSALISGLSLCLLLRTNSLELAIITAVIAISSKFFLRLRGKHLFNPTNFGLVSMMLLSDQVWISPGQWGNEVIFAFLLACLGGVVISRASRSDVSCAFLVLYAVILLGRSWWLGEPQSIPIHRLQNGALLLFSFFMISDPKTTPNSRVGRLLFALLVAAGAGFVQFGLFRTNGLLWSLAASALMVPWIDRFLPGTHYQWASAINKAALFKKGEPHETLDTSCRPASRPRPVFPYSS